MAKTSKVFARVELEIKEQAEGGESTRYFYIKCSRYVFEASCNIKGNPL